MSRPAIYSIDQERCNSCFKCVRECPVNAIRFINRKASVVDELCIDCGICHDTCPMGAVGMTNGVPKIKQLIKAHDLIVASLAPNWISEFRDIEPARMIEALKLLGFDHVSQTSIGTAAYSEEAVAFAGSEQGMVLSGICPVVSKAILKYHPTLVPLLVPAEPPHIAHARILKKHYGPQAKIVYISSCPAVVGTEGSDIDIALTFRELDRWLREENIFFDKIPGGAAGYTFEPYETNEEEDYVIPGSLMDKQKIGKNGLEGLSCISFSGIEKILPSLEAIDIEESRKHLFVDFFACTGGCIYGRGSTDRGDQLDKKNYFLRQTAGRKEEPAPAPIPVDIRKKHRPEVPDRLQNIDHREMEHILRTVSRNNIEPNCTGCGYPSCRKFAEGAAAGMTEVENCVLYMHRGQEKDFSRLLDNLKCGVCIIGKNRKITACNHRFAEIMRLQHANREIAETDIPFFETIEEMLENDRSRSREISLYNKIYELSAVPFHNGSACVLIRNIITPNTGRKEIEKKARKVIDSNLEAIQRIAYLLGENASRVEGILQDFIDNREE